MIHEHQRLSVRNFPGRPPATYWQSLHGIRFMPASTRQTALPLQQRPILARCKGQAAEGVYHQATIVERLIDTFRCQTRHDPRTSKAECS